MKVIRDTYIYVRVGNPEKAAMFEQSGIRRGSIGEREGKLLPYLAKEKKGCPALTKWVSRNVQRIGGLT